MTDFPRRSRGQEQTAFFVNKVLTKHIFGNNVLTKHISNNIFFSRRCRDHYVSVQHCFQYLTIRKACFHGHFRNSKIIFHISEFHMYTLWNIWLCHNNLFHYFIICAALWTTSHNSQLPETAPERPQNDSRTYREQLFDCLAPPKRSQEVPRTIVWLFSPASSQ